MREWREMDRWDRLGAASWVAVAALGVAVVLCMVAQGPLPECAWCRWGIPRDAVVCGRCLRVQPGEDAPPVFERDRR